jgi:hypothetical protein
MLTKIEKLCYLVGFIYNIQTVLCRVIFRDIVYPIYCVKMEGVLHRDEEERNALRRVKRRNAN